MATRFSARSFFIRLVLAFLLVFSTYNPLGYSYIHWVTSEGITSFSLIKTFVGIILVIGWIIFGYYTLRSLGKVGLLLALVFFGFMFWLIIDLLQNWLPTAGVELFQWILLLIVSFILATGVSWSHIMRRFTGQVDVDSVDN